MGWPWRDRSAAAWRIAASTKRVCLELEASQPTIRSGERVDDERGVGEHAGGQLDVGEVGDEQPIRRRRPELAVDQIR